MIIEEKQIINNTTKNIPRVLDKKIFNLITKGLSKNINPCKRMILDLIINGLTPSKRLKEEPKKIFDYDNYLNRIFGYLTLIEIIKMDRGASFKLKCVCGKEIIKPASYVVSGHIKSCGCGQFRKESANLVGRKFGKLTVLSLAPRKNNLVYWFCECDCGKSVTIRTGSLLSGNTKSCGCINPTTAPGNKSCHWKGYEEISGYFLCRLRRCAQSRGIEVDITLENIWDIYLKQNKTCALSSVPIVFNNKRRESAGSVSVDRIDSNKPYTPDNIQLVHKIVNKMKQDFPEDQFVMFCHLIAENNKKSENIDLNNLIFNKWKTDDNK